MLQKLICQLDIFFFYRFKNRTYNFLYIIVITKQFNRSINVIFQITETDNLTETFLFIKYTIGTTERLQ